MMMAYAIEELGISVFRAKIGESNGTSLNMFQKLVCLLPLFVYFFCMVIPQFNALIVPSY